MAAFVDMSEHQSKPVDEVDLNGRGVITAIHTIDSQSNELAKVHAAGGGSDDLLSGSDHFGNTEECAESLVMTNKEVQGKRTLLNYFCSVEYLIFK